MPALDFPASPTNGQVYGQYTYDSTKGAWRVTGLVGTSVVSSATPPASPVAGMLWFNTNDGVLFTYFNDGDTSQWVEVKSNTASGSTVAARVDALEAKPSGLVTVSPTSVTVSSGSASVGTNGKVTFAGASTIRFNGVFTSTYSNYKIVLRPTATSVGIEYCLMRFSSSGTDSTAASYNYVTIAASESSTSYNKQQSGIASTSASIGYFAYGRNNREIDVFNPASAFDTTFRGIGMYDYGSIVIQDVAGMFTAATLFDGFSLTINSGTFDGTLQVYGMR